MAISNRRIERLAAEIEELVEVDATTTTIERTHMGLLMGLRAWQMSLLPDS